VNLLELRGVTVNFRQSGTPAREVAAVEGVDFTIGEHEMLGLVGESGCGKTTLGRAILRLVPLAAGEVHWRGQRIDRLGARAFRPLRRELQCVFQDPNASLDPRMTLIESVAEPLRALDPGTGPEERARRAQAQLDEVGIGADLAARYPHQLSGGQLQRAVIARALILNPRFVVCDEPVSALDVSVQGQIIGLLERIRDDRGLSSLFISHNLAVVARLCERVMVMFRGRVVEAAGRRALIESPLHPYTRELLDAVPATDAGARTRTLKRAARAMPSADDIGNSPGCPFAARCPKVLPRCRIERPLLQAAAGDARLVACHRAGEWPRGLPPLAPV
jgi:oligopeptide/dipeptide ABC transporter ATP-binding protein